jgi:hypothetical protein
MTVLFFVLLHEPFPTSLKTVHNVQETLNNCAFARFLRHARMKNAALFIFGSP